MTVLLRQIIFSFIFPLKWNKTAFLKKKFDGRHLTIVNLILIFLHFIIISADSTNISLGFNFHRRST